MKKNPGKSDRFTLIELMVVLAVVLLLVSVGIMVAPMVTRQASESKTKALMAMIDNALQEYKNSDVSGGHFPISPLTTKEKTMQYTPLFLFGNETLDVDKVKGTILQFFEYEQIKPQLAYVQAGTYGGHCVNDGFGMPVLYMAPGYRMNGGYDLISLGANSMPGDVDSKDLQKSDSVIHKRVVNGFLSVVDKKEAKYAKMLGEGDDLANFKSK